VVREHVGWIIDQGYWGVVGTSGMTAEDWNSAHVKAISKNVGIITAGNFSFAAAVQKRLCQIACRHFKDWEIVDRANEKFPQAPTTTARELADSLASYGRQTDEVPIDRVIGNKESRGTIIAGTRVHSLRSSGVTISIDVHFGREGESLTVGINSGSDASLYVEGTMKSIQRVRDVRGVLRGLDVLLWGALE
jgi:4-hydroxy-tetrahydrodipicolinate reductase